MIYIFIQKAKNKEGKPLKNESNTFEYLSQNKKKMFWRIFFITLFIFAYFCTTYTGGDMQNSALSLTSCLIENQTFAITQYESTSLDIAFKDGKYYSGMAPGASILCIPLYFVSKSILWTIPESYQQRMRTFLQNLKVGTSKHLIYAPDPLFFLIFSLVTSLIIISLSSFSVAVLYFILCYYSVQQNFAISLTFVFAFGSPFFAYGAGFYTQAIATSLLILGYAGLLIAKEKKSLRFIILGGVLLGLAGATDYPYYLYTAIILIGVVWDILKNNRNNLKIFKSLSYLAVAWFLPLLVVMIYHKLAFGSIASTPYHFRIISLHQNAFLGLTFPSISRILERLFSLRDGIFSTFSIILLLPYSIFLWFKNFCNISKPDANNVLKLDIYLISYQGQIVSFILVIFAAFCYTLGISWPVSTDAGIGPRFFLAATPCTVFVLGVISHYYNNVISAYRWIVGISIFSISWHFIGNAIGPQNMISFSTFFHGFTTYGLSSFFLRNISEHAIYLHPCLATVITVAYLYLIVFVFFRK